MIKVAGIEVSFSDWTIQQSYNVDSGITGAFLSKVSNGTIDLNQVTSTIADKVLELRPELRLEYPHLWLR